MRITNDALDERQLATRGRIARFCFGATLVAFPLNAWLNDVSGPWASNIWQALTISYIALAVFTIWSVLADAEPRLRSDGRSLGILNLIAGVSFGIAAARHIGWAGSGAVFDEIPAFIWGVCSLSVGAVLIVFTRRQALLDSAPDED